MLPEKKAANLKTVAAKVGLAPCSVSAILNHTEAARAIPQATKDRVYRAAAELNYRPNLLARSLRTKRTRMVAIVAPGLGWLSVARVVAAAHGRLHKSGYMLILAAPDESDRMCAQFQQRGIEGVISIDANLPPQMNIPVTCVNLGYDTSVSNVPDLLQCSLTELGDAAAEAIIQQIETGAGSRRLKLQVTQPSYVHMQAIQLGFSAVKGA
jgi:LacI family transcriptional regulator